MNRFTRNQKRKFLPGRLLSAAAAFLCGAALLVYGISAVSDTADENQAESLKLAISRSAVHCYAMEGRYPESMDYLCEYYGIRWDPKKYAVDYEILGQNLMPSVTVIPLN